jgi:hypothetical protein
LIRTVHASAASPHKAAIEFKLFNFKFFTMKHNQNIQKTILACALLLLCIFPAFSQWTTSGSNVYLTAAANRVGLGTSSPLAKLHVSSTGMLSRFETSSSTGFVSFYKGINYVGFAGIDGDVNMGIGTAPGNLSGKAGLITQGIYRMTVRPNGNIGINTPNPWVRFEVRESSNDTTAMFYNAFPTSDKTVALGAHVAPATGNNYGNAIAVKGVSNVSTYAGIGGAFEGGLYSGHFSNGEVYSKAKDGIHSIHADAVNAEAGYFAATNGHGIFATGSGVGKYAGYFQGNVYATGSYLSSDARFKQDVQPVRNALSKIKALQPSTYAFNTKEYGFLNLPEGKQIGLMAQDLERIFPELVREVTADEHHCGEQCKHGEQHEGFTFKAVNYTALIPVLIAGMQEQQTEIEVKNKQIDELESRLARLERMMESLASDRASLPGEKTTVEGFAGNQLLGNRPNPFQHTTTIDFELAPEVQQAELLVYDQSGRNIHRVALESRGKSTLEIAMPNVPAGIYTYTIVADGKTLPAKQMTLLGRN